jgi:hypothetical protein
VLTGDDLTAEANRLIGRHSETTRAMTSERTALESRLIPVTAYILVAAAECWYRDPDMVRRIDAAMPAEAIGTAGRRPGVQVNAVYLWSVANIFLTGRKFLTLFGAVEDDAAAVHSVLDFWERAALAWRGDGHAQAWDAGLVVRPYPQGVISELIDGVRRVASDGERARIKRFNATVLAWLFLLYFDTRIGTGDTGPYRLDDGRVLLVRDFYRMSRSDFAWSDVASGVPYHNLTAALVLEGVEVRVNDWGTAITTPEDYLDHLVGFALYSTDTPDGSLRQVGLGELDAIASEVRKAQSQLYRNIAAMTRDEKIACGAYVYFTFPRPFAQIAGVAGEIDWSVPRDTVATGIYELLAQAEGTNTDPSVDVTDAYYWPIATSAE